MYTVRYIQYRTLIRSATAQRPTPIYAIERARRAPERTRRRRVGARGNEYKVTMRHRNCCEPVMYTARVCTFTRITGDARTLTQTQKWTHARHVSLPSAEHTVAPGSCDTPAVVYGTLDYVFDGAITTPQRPGAARISLSRSLSALHACCCAATPNNPEDHIGSYPNVLRSRRFSCWASSGCQKLINSTTRSESPCARAIAACVPE